MRNLKVVFFGTPYYSVYVLEKLHRRLKKFDARICAVVTQPPKPTGREKIMTYSEVDNWAYRKKIKIIKNIEEVLKLEVDLGVCASYGKLIPINIINHFPKGIINVHPSILPLFRGASPVQATIASGIDESGVSFFLMDANMDHGPILSKFTEEVDPNDTTQTLRDRLFERSSEILPGLVEAHISGKIKPKVQNEDLATYTRIISKDDGFVDWQIIQKLLKGKEVNKNWQVNFIKDFSQKYTPENFFNFHRSLTPWPGVWTEIVISDKKQKRRLKIIKMHLEPINQVTDKLTNQLTNLPTNRLVIDQVQLEGKNEVSWKQFTDAYSIVNE